MAGTLTISTLSDGTNSTSATNLVRGACVAWVNFNGTGTVAIRASYNVSSVTDNGAGDYTVNFTNALADTSYCSCATSGGDTTTSPQEYKLAPYSQATQLTTSARFNLTRYSGSTVDCTIGNIAFFR